MEFETRGNESVIRRIAPRFSRDELFRGRSADAWGAEYAGAYGRPDIGRAMIVDGYREARRRPAPDLRSPRTDR